MLNITLRRKARQFSKLVRHSALTRRTGEASRPILAKSGQMAVTFIGHSSFFLQIGGLNVVVDPNFAKWIFVLKRLRRPGVRIRELPAIDVVLVSHAHFDHLHRPSLRAIARQSRRVVGKAPIIIVPEHVADLVSDLGFRKVIELKWWEDVRFGDVGITHVPANHWGARIIRDMHRGFGGFVLKSNKHSIYHAGDTAYFEGFSEIGRRLQPELALLPIGAYNPPSFRNVHTNPEDAVQAFIDLQARWMIPMHYGTFRLSHEPVKEPVEFLEHESERRGVRDRVLVLKEGITRIFS
ncbi:MAG TPA: MBL fold metallo-hydrolase [Terriglobales bacterium]|nr:MBL fold metallo-hydrolase [Terriglobales bacterium]